MKKKTLPLFVILLWSSIAYTQVSSPLAIKNPQEALAGYELYKTFNPELKGKEDFLERLQKAFKKDYHLYFLKKDNKVVAILGFSFPQELYWGRYLHIDSLVVHTNYRRQGLGRQLIQFAKDVATRKKVTKLCFETDLDNENAQAFYKTLGFEPITYEYRFYPPKAFKD